MSLQTIDVLQCKDKTCLNQSNGRANSSDPNEGSSLMPMEIEFYLHNVDVSRVHYILQVGPIHILAKN